MALHHVTVTLSGATKISATSVQAHEIILESETGNADVKVGGSTVASGDYGFILEAGPTKRQPIAPGVPYQLNLNSVYLLGTDTQKVHVTYVS